MLRCHARRGVSLVAVQAALLASSSGVFAQNSNTVLPAVTVEAPQAARPKPAVTRPSRLRSASAGRAVRRVTPNANVSAPTQGRTVTARAARDGLNQSPAGQTATTIDRSQFDNRPSFSVSDVLRDSPGISIKQGNGPRDFGISIRGSNARNGFGIRNLVIFDDGFPVTQPDGLSRSDLIDPHAYAAIDVIRGPSSALYGQLRDRRRAQFPNPAGRHDRRRRVWCRRRQLRLSQQLPGSRQEGREFRELAVCKRHAGRRLHRQ
ncbi:outer membrane receptor protein involved in Fe transport [Bradyrhizobium sp. LM6.11]